MPRTNTLLLETIKIEDGKVHNIQYHQSRCNKSRKILFNSTDVLALLSHINAPSKGLYRCRIIYDTQIRSVEYIPYQEKDIQSLKIVQSTLDYIHKYEDRSTLASLIEANIDADDILIEKNGLITDTSIANIAFYAGGKWFTPKTPLLEGTQRAKLLDTGFLTTEDIKKEELSHYTQVALMNAMIGFKILEDPKILM
jgi:4-amino-4-deoxychorismate lyase